MTKASAPFSVFSRAAAGTSDDSVGDGLGDTDALGEALLAVADGLGDAEGVSSDWHPPSTTAAPSATAAIGAATDRAANGILIDRRPMPPLPRPPLVGLHGNASQTSRIRHSSCPQGPAPTRPPSGPLGHEFAVLDGCGGTGGLRTDPWRALVVNGSTGPLRAAHATEDHAETRGRGRGDAVAVEIDHHGARPKSGRAALGDTWRALRAVFVKPSLRRMQLALAASLVGDWAYSTAVTVWAYGEGGAPLVGLWAGVRLALIAVATPLGSTIVDRLSRKAVLLVSTLVRAGLVAAAVVALVVDAPAWLVLVLATLAPLVGCVFRPAQLAWLPSLTSHPGELTAANGASSTIDSLAFLIGPAIGGLVVATTSVETMFVVTAVMFLAAAGLVARIHPDVEDLAGHELDRPAPHDEADAGGDRSSSGSQTEPSAGLLRDMASGFTMIGRDGNLVMVMVLICVQMVVSGAMVVLGVVFAVDILGTGPAGVGLIDSVLGIGAVVGGFVAIARSVRNKIALDLVTGTLLWAFPLLFVVVAPSPVTVFAMVAVLGFGLPLVDVNYATLTMRLIPDGRLGRVFGAMEGPASARWRSALP